MSKIKVGDIRKSNKYGDYEIIKRYNTQKYRVRFLLTNYEKDICASCVIYGEIRDPYYPIYYGVACQGNIKKANHKKEFNLWKFMIERCYNKNHKGYKLYGEKGIRVCDRWLCFEYFYKDIPNIKGYNEQKFLKGEIQLDKDMSYIGSNNKIYSIETCIFLPNRINFDEMLGRRKLTTTSRYVGVTRLKDGKWQVTYVHNSKNIYGGRYETEYEAHLAYEKLKEKYNEKLSD